VAFGPSSKVKAINGPSTYTELKVIWGPEGVDGGFGFGAGEMAFSTRGTGFGSCPEAICPIRKLIAKRADNRRKSMEFERRARKLGLSSRAVRQRKQPALKQLITGPQWPEKTIVSSRFFPEMDGNFGNYPAQERRMTHSARAKWCAHSQ
jgi:hypothetical protein